MSRREIKDDHYRTLGYIETDSSGKEVAKDSHYKVLGYFDPKRNETTDSHYKVLAKGNILSGLIYQSR